MKWITVPTKVMQLHNGEQIKVPDCPTYFRCTDNGDGTFDVLVDDEK